MIDNISRLHYPTKVSQLPNNLLQNSFEYLAKLEKHPYRSQKLPYFHDI